MTAFCLQSQSQVLYPFGMTSVKLSDLKLNAVGGVNGETAESYCRSRKSHEVGVILHFNPFHCVETLQHHWTLSVAASLTCIEVLKSI